jgi:hypothetical protein
VFLSQEIDRALVPYRLEYDAIVESWMCTEGTFGFAYPAFLVETYHYVRHSCELMRSAWEGIGRDRSELRNYLEQHIEEERGHEQWVLNDLENLGYQREAVTQSLPLSETIELIGSQMYVVRHIQPAGLVGYVYMMESRPPNHAFLRALQAAYSIPSSAMTFLAGHGDADIVHSQELRDVLNHLLSRSLEGSAARTSAVLGLANINRLFFRLKSGEFISADPVPRRFGHSQSLVERLSTIGREIECSNHSGGLGVEGVSQCVRSI